MGPLFPRRTRHAGGDGQPSVGAAASHRGTRFQTEALDPQLGRIGLNEREAKKQGRRYRVARMPMSYVARALEMDESRGVMKVLVDPDTRQLLGAAVLGIEGGELMAMLQLAMMGNLPYDRLRDAVFAHPTLAESLNNLFSTLEAV